ncbi:putative LRR receptor-like serine/threonine-protein kinase At1g05700 [Carex rostrata]
MVLWSLILLLISAVTIPVHSQLDSQGFLSIDCGIPPNFSYIDTLSNLSYVSDEQFIDTGVNIQIPPSNGLPRAFETVRSFPTGIRNCYTLRSLTVGSKYLIRATFNYANYDKLNKPPIFDIYLGVNFWDTVNSSSPFYPEIIVNTTADYLHVCLVNKNLGNPFICSLHLRQLNSRTYQEAHATQSLIWVRRANLGGSKKFPFIRYPEDKYDRWWFTETLKGTTEISTNSTIQSDDDFEIPSIVKQTAATTNTTEEPLNLNWITDEISNKYYLIFHFYEIQTSLTGPREFDILINGDKPFNKPTILQTWNSSTMLLSSFTNYNVSLVATSNSTLPPLLNGYELYKIAPVGVPTYGADVAAINSIKHDHQIKKGWSGDPCLPKVFIWTGVNCTSNSSNITRITALDLSSNNLSGSLPSSLDQLIALTYLDIRGNNNISTILPLGLQQKQQNGTLTYR